MISLDDIVDLRRDRQNNTSIQNWHTRIKTIDGWYAGDVNVMFPGERSANGLPVTGNVVQIGLDDIARLVSETQPTVRCEPEKNTDTEKHKAEMRERVQQSYWDYGRGAILEPRLAMDLSGGGAAFLLCYANKKVSAYPKPIRLNPRNCYPDLSRMGHQSNPNVDEGLPDTELYNLLHVSKLPVAQVEKQYGLSFSTRVKEVEIIDYYDSELMGKIAVGLAGQGLEGAKWIGNPLMHELERIPVSFAQMDTFDGSFRGVFDQVVAPLNTRNALASIVIDHADRATYAQPVVYDIENEGDIGYPDKTLRKLSPEGGVGRVPTEQLNPAIPYLLDQLNREIRMGSAYPEQRSGSVDQSIASAAFVASTQGVLTTLVRNADRLLAVIRQDFNSVAYALDEKMLDFDKPLSRPIKDKATYKPSKDIAGKWWNRVTYGFTAGLDKLTQRTALEQALGMRLISKETARENLEEVPDPLAEEQKIQRETAEDVLFQMIVSSGDMLSVATVVEQMADGKSIAEVAAILRQQQEAAMAAQQQQQPQEPGAPQPLPGETQPGEVQSNVVALQKGGIPGGENQAPAPPIDFGSKPFTSVQVRPP